MAKMKSEEHVWQEKYYMLKSIAEEFNSNDNCSGIKDMEEIDAEIARSGYAHWYNKRGGGSVDEYNRIKFILNKSCGAIGQDAKLHKQGLASIDSKFAEKMKYSIRDHLNKVNGENNKYKAVHSTKTEQKTVAYQSGYYASQTSYQTVTETRPMTNDEMLKFEHPSLSGLKEKYQQKMDEFKKQRLNDQNVKLSDEERKQISEMNVTQFLGYTGVHKDYKGALSDHEQQMKNLEMACDIIAGGLLIVAAVAAAPFTGGSSLVVAVGTISGIAGATYFVGKAGYGFATGKNMFTGETLSNTDKAWLAFDAVSSVFAVGAAAKAFSLGGKAVGFGSKVINTVTKSAQIGDNICNVVQAGMAVKAGTDMIGQGNYLGGATLLGLGALGAKGSFGGKANKISGEIAEDIERGATKTTRAAERVGEFTDKVAKYASDAKVNITNTFDNATVTFAHAMGFGDNFAFAGGAGRTARETYRHSDNIFEKIVVKMEGAGGDIGKSLNHVDDEFERTAGKITKKLKDEVPPLEKYPTYEEAKNTLFKNSEFPPSEKMYNENIDVYNKTKYFSQETGDFIYPPNNGAVKGTNRPVQAEVGQIVDRYGFDPKKGQYFGRMGDSFESRSLPPSNNPKYGGVQYTKYEVLKPFEWEEGEIAQWFGKNTGGGKQWYVDVDEVKVIHKETGELIPATLENLLNNNYLNIL